MDKHDLKNLQKRYLAWLYKTTKEVLDRIERKFTQLEIDRFILKELKKLDKEKSVAKPIEEFQTYIQNKEKDGLSQKYEGSTLKPDYYFLSLKLKAVEKAIIKRLGRAGLQKIKSSYEEEMLRRILEERENKT